MRADGGGVNSRVLATFLAGGVYWLLPGFRYINGMARYFILERGGFIHIYSVVKAIIPHFNWHFVNTVCGFIKSWHNMVAYLITILALLGRAIISAFFR